MSNGGSSGFGPGLWVADIEKLYQGEYWTNRYIVSAASLADATTAAVTIADRERAVTRAPVLFTKLRVSDGQPNTDIYQITTLNYFGQLGNSTDLLPLFVVYRVDFTTAGGGRPSRKYLRGCLEEGDVAFNTISAANVTRMNTDYVTPLVSLAAFVDVDGQEITAGQTHPFVSMRQLRRGSKRKAPAASNPAP